MARLENFGDLHKYIKTSLDDDYNHGQQLVVKTGSKSSDGSAVSSSYKHLLRR